MAANGTTDSSTPVMANSDVNGGTNHDVVVDAANDRYFFTDNTAGVYEANLDGTTGPTTLVPNTDTGGITGVVSLFFFVFRCLFFVYLFTCRFYS